MVKFVTFIFAALGAAAAHASIESELSRMEGWCIIAVKTIEAFVNDNGQREDGFEGCEFDRKIIFTDGTYLTCSGYGYQYSYLPEAVIFAKNVTYKGRKFTTFKMLVDDEIYEMRN